MPRTRKKRSRSLSVLVVDDRRFNQKAVSRLLRLKGCRVTTRANGREAFNEVRSKSYDLVFLDTQMPLMSGFDAARAIRNLEKESERHLPLIGMVAKGCQEESEQCLDSGMDAHIVKPVTHNELFETVKIVLRDQQEGEESSFQTSFEESPSDFGVEEKTSPSDYEGGDNTEAAEAAEEQGDEDLHHLDDVEVADLKSILESEGEDTVVSPTDSDQEALDRIFNDEIFSSEEPVDPPVETQETSNNELFQFKGLFKGNNVPDEVLESFYENRVSSIVDEAPAVKESSQPENVAEESGSGDFVDEFEEEAVEDFQPEDLFKSYDDTQEIVESSEQGSTLEESEGDGNFQEAPIQSESAEIPTTDEHSPAKSSFVERIDTTSSLDRLLTSSEMMLMGDAEVREEKEPFHQIPVEPPKEAPHFVEETPSIEVKEQEEELEEPTPLDVEEEPIFEPPGMPEIVETSDEEPQGGEIDEEVVFVSEPSEEIFKDVVEDESQAPSFSVAETAVSDEMTEENVFSVEMEYEESASEGLAGEVIEEADEEAEDQKVEITEEQIGQTEAADTALPSMDDIAIEDDVSIETRTQAASGSERRVIDLKKAMDIHENDKEFFKENACEFAAAVPRSLDRIRSDLGSGDLKNIADISRKVAGAGSYLGAEEVIHLARRIHKMASQGDSELLADHIQQLEEAVVRFKSEVDHI